MAKVQYVMRYSRRTTMRGEVSELDVQKSNDVAKSRRRGSGGEYGMRANIPTTIVWVGLIISVIFNAVSAVGGAIAMLFTDGLGMPAAFLDRSPFSSFIVPALILLVAIGGTHALAAVLLLRRRGTSLLWAAVAGFAMTIWILVETVVIQGFSWLQGIHFTTGVAELALVLAALGIVSWVPRVDLGTKTPESIMDGAL